MSFIVEPGVEEYAVAASSPHPLDELFERLAAETRERTTAPQMMVGPLEGRFLELLVRLTRARRVLELGTFTGYSSISMARGLPDGGRIISCDVDEDTNAIARRYAEEAGVAERKTERVNVWLTPEQVAWLKTKKNVSETVRAMVTEAMNLDRLRESVRRGARRGSGSSAPPRSPRSRKGGSSRARGR